MKIFAFYLPQYHSIPENDAWWGKGYTEWDSLRRGKMLIPDQYQPRIPLDSNYYNLLDVEVMRWQTSLARKYGISGFCVYHYWFDGKLLLEKPMENYLDSNIDFPFYFCWANENWTNIWEGDVNHLKTLMTHNYENKRDWQEHFEYLLRFFNDSRYIKENNCPLLCIYEPQLVSTHTLKLMMNYWDEQARNNGFSGIKYLYQSPRAFVMMDSTKRELFDYGIEYYPNLVDMLEASRTTILKGKIVNSVSSNLRKINRSILDRKIDDTKITNGVKTIQDYDSLWKKILSIKPQHPNIIPGAFVDWDNTPRRMKLGKVVLGASPDKFRKYFYEQLIRAHEVYKQDTVYVFAWNEWSEGGYLEPDERYGYGYLEAILQSLTDYNNNLNLDNS